MSERARYGPGRRRKPIVAVILDWAAGVLIGILATITAAGAMRLFVEPGFELLGAQVLATFVAWPLGATLGVWLSAGQPRSGRGFGYGLGLTVLGSAIVLLPFWLDLESEAARGVAGIAALVLAPVFARVGVELARKHADS